jgi:hypothetical protein
MSRQVAGTYVSMTVKKLLRVQRGKEICGIRKQGKEKKKDINHTFFRRD